MNVFNKSKEKIACILLLLDIIVNFFCLYIFKVYIQMLLSYLFINSVKVQDQW